MDLDLFIAENNTKCDEVINTSASSNYFLPFNVTSGTPVTSLHRALNLTRQMLIFYSIQSLHNHQDIE